MKKHRKFLIFYSLWLGAIFLMLIAFDTAQDTDKALMKDPKAICEQAQKTPTYSKRHECAESRVVRTKPSGS